MPRVRGKTLPLPKARRGSRLKIRNRVLPFSFWPVYKSGRRYGLNTDLFSKNPWPVMTNAVQERCPSSTRAPARAFLTQAEDFYRASESEIQASKPLLLYYSFLNIAKAFILATQIAGNLDEAKHGLKERVAPGGGEFVDATVTAFPSSSTATNIFDLFGQALGCSALIGEPQYRVLDLLPQIVSGHRLWTMAADETERFIPINETWFMENEKTRRIWATVTILREDLDRFGIAHTHLLSRSGLRPLFREVRPREGGTLLRFEQLTPVPYTDRTSDVVMEAVKTCKPLLWPIVRSIPPYRKYYLYLAPDGTTRLPPLLSLYTLVFYLGSVTRYRPHHFQVIQDSAYAPQVAEILATEPRQFLFLMASEFAERNVNWPAIL